MTYFELFARCLSIAAKIPVEEVRLRFKKFSEYKDPPPLFSEEAPDKIATDLLAMAETDPESVIKFAVGGMAPALETIKNITRH